MAGYADRLLELATEIGALTYGDYTLSWGGKSRFYFDGRLLSLEPEGAYIIGQSLLPYVTGAGATAVGGPTLGADPMVAAIAMTSHMTGRAHLWLHRAQRDQRPRDRKAHRGAADPGAARWPSWTTPAPPADPCFRPSPLPRTRGCEVVKVLSVLDRREGGSEKLRERGYNFSSLLVATPEGEIMVAQDA